MKQKPINKYSQKLGYITKKIIFLSFFLSFIACSKKVEDKMLDNTTEMTNARIGEEVETVEKNEENIFQLSPVRDLERLDPALVKEYVSSVIAQEQIIDEPSDEFVIPCGGINPAPSTIGLKPLHNMAPTHANYIISNIIRLPTNPTNPL